MKVTLQEIAEEVGVSIATVSFALNRTRYVSPELVQRIEEAAREKGYHSKREKQGRMRRGRLSEIALVIPSLDSSFYTHVIPAVSRKARECGYMMAVYVSDNDREREKHILDGIMSSRRVAGVILSPSCEEEKAYSGILSYGIPLVFIERMLSGETADSVISDNAEGIRRATEYLIKCGHEKIVLLLEKRHLSSVDERKKGYDMALNQYGLSDRGEMVVGVVLQEKDSTMETIAKVLREKRATAVLAGGNVLTLYLLEVISKLGINCPEELSVIGFGDGDWCGLVKPPLTVLKQNIDKIAEEAVAYITDEKREKGSGREKKIKRIPMEFCIRNSVQNIARGPFGERAVYPEEIVLSEEDERLLKSGNYRVALAFHYSGDEWTSLHEKAILETLSGYGIHVLTVTDAHFDPELQKTQLEGIMMQKPDAVIAVPVDEEKTAGIFLEVAKQTRLILINSMPRSLKKEDYACWISVNERENGQNAARILGDHFMGRDNAKIGLLVHGAEYFATRQRDFFAEETLRDQYPAIEIVNKKSFGCIENAYEACRRMMEETPEIEGLYVTWERPALEAIRALKDLRRRDVVISTTDLDYEIASYMAKGEMVIGLSSQRPYDQGVVAAVAAAKALLGRCDSKCIGVPPYRVEAEKLERAWKDLIKTKMPILVKK